MTRPRHARSLAACRTLLECSDTEGFSFFVLRSLDLDLAYLSACVNATRVIVHPLPGARTVRNSLMGSPLNELDFTLRNKRNQIQSRIELISRPLLRDVCSKFRSLLVTAITESKTKPHKHEHDQSSCSHCLSAATITIHTCAAPASAAKLSS